MKKLIAVIAAAALSISMLVLPVSAELSILGSITHEGVITVSGYGNPGFVSVEIIRGEADANFASRNIENSLIVDSAQTDSNGAFSFSWELPASELNQSKENRNYTALVGNTGNYAEAEMRSLPLYLATEGEINGALVALRTAIQNGSIADLNSIFEGDSKTLQVAGVISDTDYTSNKSAVLSSVIEQGKAQKIETLEQLGNVLIKAIGVASLNSATEANLGLIVLKYAETLGLDVSAYDDDADLAFAMSRCVTSVLDEYDLQLPQDAPEAFRSIEAVAFINIAARGEIIGALDSYRDIFGIDVTTLSTAEKTQIAAAICVTSRTQEYKTVAGIKRAYNDALADIDDNDNNNKNNNSYSGDRAGTGSYIGSNEIIEIAPVEKETVESKSLFDDVDSVPWAKEYIESLALAGIISGKSEGVFDPLTPVTREEFTKMLALAIGLPLDVEAIGFTDVIENEWYAPYINAATAAKLLYGYDDGTIGIGSAITREEAATLIARAAAYAKCEIAPVEELAFIDTLEISEFAVNSVKTCQGAEIIQGNHLNQFLPRASLTRAECAKMIFCMMKLL